MKRIVKLTPLFIFFILLSGCAAKKDLHFGSPGIRNFSKKIEPTFESLNKNVFSLKCAGCHSGSNPPHGVDLSDYANVMNDVTFPPLVVRGNPEASSIYKSIVTGAMPKKSAPLEQDEIEAIYVWIKNGAKEHETDPVPTPAPTPDGCAPNEPGCN